jgi:1-aminocyclopropane-1-carboxylate deaminase/D-cysteine desulfhydrase-like pyridoxal-dependent ACC family enzyme
MQVARETGLLLDPIYSLAAWESALELSEQHSADDADARVVMLHSGGSLGLHGLAQRYPEQF